MDPYKKDDLSYFEKSNFVKELSPKDFDSYIPWKLKGNKCAIVLYYAPWCQYCKAVKDTWLKLGETAAFFDVYALNVEKHKAHMAKIKEDMPNLVTSYPTIIIYQFGKPKEQYQGERTLKKLTEACMRVCS